MRMIEIVALGLQAGGFNGLAVPGVCGCIVGELSPADCLSDSCEPGYKHTHSERSDQWVVSTKRDGVTDADIERTIRECC